MLSTKLSVLSSMLSVLSTEPSALTTRPGVLFTAIQSKSAHHWKSDKGRIISLAARL